MWKENLYQPVEVLIRRHSKFPIDEHQHSFYEMAYVREGSGTFYVREEGCRTQLCRYRARSLFLIPPATVHRFTAGYAADYLGRRIEQALQASVGRCAVSLTGRDAQTVDRLFAFIEEEEKARREVSNQLIRSWLNSILVLAADHYLQLPDHEGIPVAEPSDRALYLLQYIQQQIASPERLTCEALGERFHLSPTYVGPYFKRHFQEDLRHYIRRIRIRAIEHLLTESSLTVKEIAARLGYVDSAHLIKAFRDFHAMTPLEFRARNRR